MNNACPVPSLYAKIELRELRILRSITSIVLHRPFIGVERVRHF
jgi:hypothetical protein